MISTVIKSVRASRGDNMLIVWLCHRFGCVRGCAGWGTEHFTSKLMQAIVTFSCTVVITRPCPTVKRVGYKKKQGVSILFKVKKGHEVKRSYIGWS